MIRLVREIYRTDEFIPLHKPRFWGKEKDYLVNTIDSNFVSSVGKYVDDFEKMIAEFTGAKYAIATVNGTSALHTALILSGVEAGDEVLTQPITFVGSCNAIRYCHADPVFVDVDRNSLGLSAEHLLDYLEKNVEKRNKISWNRTTGRRIGACLPMHTFGHPVEMSAILEICAEYYIPIIEDAAESLGSTLHTQHTGTFGRVGILSFNGNKIMTTGGGGMLLTNNESLAKHAKHLTTTAKQPHAWQYVHDETGYNYRMPNLNAALGIAQLEQLPGFIEKKRLLAQTYLAWCDEIGVRMLVEPKGARSNYWLNALILENQNEREDFLQYTNDNGIMTRPVWEPMHLLPMYKQCHHGPLENTTWAMDRVVNIPSSVPGTSTGLFQAE